MTLVLFEVLHQTPLSNSSLSVQLFSKLPSHVYVVGGSLARSNQFVGDVDLSSNLFACPELKLGDVIKWIGTLIL
jgi:hypothetical protein